MKFYLNLKSVLVFLLLVSCSFFTLIDTKAKFSIPFDYISVLLVIILILALSNLKVKRLVFFLIFLFCLFTTYLTRVEMLSNRELLFLVQLFLFSLFIFVVSDDALDEFRLKYYRLTVLVLILSFFSAVSYVLYYFFTQPYVGRVSMPFNSSSSYGQNYHLYGFCIGMQLLTIANLRLKLSAISTLASPIIVLLVGARNLILLWIVAAASRKWIVVLAAPFLLYGLSQVDISEFRVAASSLQDQSVAGRLDKLELAIINLDFINLFIGQPELLTLYWDNLFANLLVNVGLFMAIISFYYVYEKLRYFRYPIIVVLLSTFITEFHLVASGLFWGLIIPSTLIRNKHIN